MDDANKLRESSKVELEKVTGKRPVATVTIEIPYALESLTDSYLVGLWHVAQMNPADLGDKAASEAAARIGAEIVRRFCRSVGPELYRHQADDHYWKALTKFATWNGSEWVLDTDKYQERAPATQSNEGGHD